MRLICAKVIVSQAFPMIVSGEYVQVGTRQGVEISRLTAPCVSTLKSHRIYPRSQPVVVEVCASFFLFAMSGFVDAGLQP